MISNRLRIVRSLCSWSNRSIQDGSTIAKTRVALVLLSALPFSSLAHGQTGQPTVVALPYVLTNTNGVVVVQTDTVAPVPPAVGISTFGSLFGGGFAAATSSLPLSTTAVTAAFVTKKLTLVKNTVDYKKQVNDWQQNANQQRQDVEDEIEAEDGCAVPNVSLVVMPNGKFGWRKKSPSESNLANPHRASSRTMARRSRLALPLLAAADTCELPQEQNADQMEANLEALDESETASEDAIEAAEAAVDAAEATAEAAEAAVEGALEAAEILETILEACSLF